MVFPHAFRSALLLKSLLGVLSANDCQETGAIPNSATINEQTAYEEVDHWIAAVRDIHQVDVSGLLIRYDLSFEVAKYSRFRYVAQGSQRAFFEKRPVDLSLLNRATHRRKRDSRPFDSESSDHEIMLFDGMTVMSLDPVQYEGIRIDRARHGSVREHGLKNVWVNLVSEFTEKMMNQAIARPPVSCLHDASLEEFCGAMKWTRVRQSNGAVFLRGTPATEKLSAEFSVVDVALDIETHLPSAIQFTDVSGTSERVYLIERRAINGCPEHVEQLLHPNLDRFKITQL